MRELVAVFESFSQRLLQDDRFARRIRFPGVGVESLAKEATVFDGMIDG